MRTVVVASYDLDWPVQYRSEVEALAAVLGDQVTAVHHIGSTAVPGIPAKPVIDILVEVRDIEKVDDFNMALQGLGYLPKGEFGIPGRRFFIEGYMDGKDSYIREIDRKAEVWKGCRTPDRVLAAGE